jgi:SAM-dependent methyltransferase
MIRRIFNFLKIIGINPKIFINTVKSIPWYLNDYREIKKQLDNNNDFKIRKIRPIFTDKYDSSGVLSGHYFHQDLLIAQMLFQNNPVKHVDIGSRTDGFVAHVAAFREIEVFDIRPLNSKIENIKFVQADFTSVNEHLYNYTDSISCLHAIEHFGLGRYNDPIDVDGHIKGLKNIYNVLKKDGHFYFGTPIGTQRIEFNAHRVFDITYLLDLFIDLYYIKSFSYVNDNGDLFKNVPLTNEDAKANFGCTYGCGIFELVKL